MIWTDSFGEGTTLNKQKRADLLLVMVTFFWGASYYLTNLCLTDLQPMNLNAFRFLSAFAVLGVVFRKRLRRMLYAARRDRAHGDVCRLWLRRLAHVGVERGVYLRAAGGCDPDLRLFLLP